MIGRSVVIEKQVEEKELKVLIKFNWELFLKGWEEHQEEIESYLVSLSFKKFQITLEISELCQSEFRFWQDSVK